MNVNGVSIFLASTAINALNDAKTYFNYIDGLRFINVILLKDE